jgi:multidrug efflux system membrane fusion protein
MFIIRNCSLLARILRLPVANLLLLLSLLGLNAGCSGSGGKSTARASGQQIVQVTVATAEQRDMPIYLSGLGSVTAYNTVDVRSRIDGQLVEIAFREGQFVNKGDLLAIIDPRPYQVQLSQMEAQLFRDQAQLRDAKVNYDRYKGLLQESGAMSQQQVDTQKAQVDQLEGAVRADQAQIDNAKLQISYCHITAPISGRVGLRQVDSGNMVHASDSNPMLVITQLQPIAVLFTLPQDNLPVVAHRMAQGTLTVDAYSRDDQTKLTSGKLLTIDNQIDQTTGTGKLKAVFDNKDNQLWPNQFVNIRLLLEVRKNSTLVPAAAVQHGPQGNFVYVLKSDNTVEVRPVTVAVTQNNIAAISEGLSPKEVVVTEGQDKLEAGSKVQPRAGSHSRQTPGASGNNATAGSPAS